MKKLLSLLSAATLSISLHAELAVQVDQPAARPLPVSFSVPLAAGNKDAAFSVSSAQGELPVQSRILVKHPDGSPKWVQLTVPRVAGKLAVREGISVAPVVAPVEVTGQNGVIELKNGLADLIIERAGGLIALRRGGESLELSLPQMTLAPDQALTPEIREIRTVAAGPLKTTIRLLGGFRESRERSWELSLSFYANAAWVEAECVFGFILPGKGLKPQQELTRTVSAGLILRGNFGGKTLAAADRTGGKILGRNFVQWEFDQLDADGKKLNETQLDGVFAIDGKPWSAVLSIPELAEQYPLGVRLDGDRLRIDLMPAIAPADRYAGRKDEHMRTSYLRTGNYEIRGGVEKSYRFYFGLEAPAAGLRQTAAALQVMPVGLVAPDDLNRARVWPHRLVPAGGKFAPYDEAIKLGAGAYFGRQRREGWYGMLNWGDWFGEREYNWGNHEYDTPSIFFEQGIRFKDPEYFREAVRGARHFIDVDVVKNDPDPEQNGAVWAHSIGHTGGYYDNTKFSLANYGQGSEIFIDGRHTAGHTRSRGTAMAYVMTGNPRFLEQALAIGDYIRRDPMFVKKNWPSTAREPGWALFNLCSLYDFTGEPRFLEAANQLGDIVILRAAGHGVKFNKLSDWNGPEKPGGLKPEDKKFLTGELSFPTGYQCAGMIELYRLTGREDVRKNLNECADYIMERLYFPDRRGFVHSPCPWRTQSTRLGGTHAASLRYALAFNAAVNGRKDLLPVIDDTTRQMFEKKEIFDSPLKDEKADWPHPKSFSSTVYFWPQTLMFLEEARSK